MHTRSLHFDTGRTAGVAAFFALVTLAAMYLLGQWLLAKLGDPSARIDIAEWPFVVIGAALAVVPLLAAVGLAMRRPFGTRLGRVSASMLLVIGAIVLAYGLAQLTMGVNWTLLIGGAVVVVGAASALRVLPAKRS